MDKYGICIFNGLENALEKLILDNDYTPIIKKAVLEDNLTLLLPQRREDGEYFFQITVEDVMNETLIYAAKSVYKINGELVEEPDDPDSKEDKDED